MSRLEQELEKIIKSLKTRRTVLIFIFISAFAGIIGGSVYWILSDLPRLNAIEEYLPIESSKVYSADEKLLAELYYERRTFVPYYEIPEHVKKAFIAIEDVRFYEHTGVDFRGILRALWQDIKAGSIVQGGSTITQQLAKMLFLKPEKSLMRKIKEAVISIQIEKRYTKDEILGLYLNQTYFGTRAFGVEAAAQTYFGKSVSNLSIGEAALLATLPKAPSLYSPFINPKKSEKRRKAVLKAMLKNKFITSVKYDEALKEPLPASPHFRKYEAPYFIEFLRQQLEKEYGSEVYTAGYKIHSTIDSNMQHIAEETLAQGIKTIEKRVNPGIQGALIAIDIHTGHIKAMVGGFDFWQNQFNRATQALRQPGSSFKPFVYLTALTQGMTHENTIYDLPILFVGSQSDKEWSPKNYNDEYHGEVTLQTALAKSLNAATVYLATIVGIENIVDESKNLGIKSRLHPYPALALGASDLTLKELVGAFSVFATGNRMEIISYERIENRDRILIEENYPKYIKVLDENIIEEMKILLSAVINEGTGIRAKTVGRTVYGKTGTTNDFNDAWFIGFDENVSVGVWIGRDDHTPIGKKETGARTALPIWIEFMKKIEPYME